MIYYLTLWFPSRHRVRMLGYFTLGSSLGNMVGAPICGWLLDKGGFLDLQGWQLVFIVTGIPSILLTAVVLLSCRVAACKAKFLPDGEKNGLPTGWSPNVHCAQVGVRRLAPFERSDRTAGNRHGALLHDAFYFVYGVSYWLPTLVKGFGVTNTANGMMNILPWLPRRSSSHVAARRNCAPANRTMAAMLAPRCSASCFSSAAFSCRRTRCVSSRCAWARLACILLLPCFWTLPPKFLTGARAAAGIAAINSLGNVGGFVAQNLVPWVGRRAAAQGADADSRRACLFSSRVVTLILMRRERRDQWSAPGRGAPK